MNLYVVVEGKVEGDVYPIWIPRVNPKLRNVPRIDDVTEDCFYLISGGGYPGYFDVINNAIEDVNDNRIFDKLIIAIDSEKFTYEEKYEEISNYLKQKQVRVEVKIIIQHFCIETWALGNRKIIRKPAHIQKLREYIQFYHVRIKDPEFLPAYPKEGLNRSQFAEKYLRLALNDKYRNLTYTKTAPYVILHPA